jgi:hypothetical protein
MTTDSTTPTLDFVVFHTADPDQSQDFFIKLGFQVVPEESSPTFRFLKGPEGSPAFGLLLAGEETGPAGTVKVYFKTHDLENLRQEVVSRGIEASPILHPPFGDIFNVTAPGSLNVIMLQG